MSARKSFKSQVSSLVDLFSQPNALNCVLLVKNGLSQIENLFGSTSSLFTGLVINFSAVCLRCLFNGECRFGVWIHQETCCYPQQSEIAMRLTLVLQSVLVHVASHLCHSSIVITCSQNLPIQLRM